MAEVKVPNGKEDNKLLLVAPEDLHINLPKGYDEEKLTEQDFITAVNNIGYGAALYGEGRKKTSLSSEWEERKKDEAEKSNGVVDAVMTFEELQALNK